MATAVLHFLWLHEQDTPASYQPQCDAYYEMEKGRWSRLEHDVKINFPSAIMVFEVHEPITQGSQGYIPRLVRYGVTLIFTAPIPLKDKDRIWLDYRNGNVEVIERGGIAIWRSGWLN